MTACVKRERMNPKTRLLAKHLKASSVFFEHATCETPKEKINALQKKIFADILLQTHAEMHATSNAGSLPCI